MKIFSVVFAGLMMSVAMSGTSVAASADSSAQPKSGTGSAKIADKDFGRLSSDGASAFDDVHMARLAIFDGDTNMAAKLVADAQVSLKKAKTDDTVFTKAESEFHAPYVVPKPQGKQVQITTPAAWIPIDGELVLGETFQSTPEKAAAFVTARKSLENGEGAKSLEAIKLAAMDVDYTMTMAPLEKSLADLAEANRLIIGRDYYGASQALRQAEEGIRYDEIDDVANVKGQTKSAMAKNK
jgi:hypothetical protein